MFPCFGRNSMFDELITGFSLSLLSFHFFNYPFQSLILSFVAKNHFYSDL
uniref:Uncharacterized protein n=1 Tax=Arundo donax TaxID=35708 RepID=A0A0A8Y7U0_ARUDO